MEPTRPQGTQKSREEELVERAQVVEASGPIQGQQVFEQAVQERPRSLTQQPKISDGTSYQFRFPCGVVNAKGELFRGFNIKPMTGLVRKEVARPENRKNASRAITIMLKLCISEIEGVTRVTEEVLRSLTVADRDYATLKIRELSISPTIDLNMECPHCQEKLDITVDLSEVELKNYDDTKFEFIDGMFQIEIKDPELGIQCSMRLPTGEDQEKILPIIKNNPLEGNYKLMARCMVHFLGRDNLDSSFFESLPVRHIDSIEAKFTENLPGPDLRPHVNCSVCGEDTPASMDIADFLFSSPQKKQ